MISRALVLALFVAAFAVRALWSQQTEAPQDSRTESAPSEDAEEERIEFQASIVVTAERGETARDEVSSAITVVGESEIGALPVRDLSEVLAIVPGFSVPFSHPASGRPMIVSRGFSGGGEVEYVRLLVDGIPQGDVESGLVDLRTVPLHEIERVEIVRSPGSQNYGDNSMGGVIQLFTRHAEPGSEITALRASGDTFESGDVTSSYRRAFAPGDSFLAMANASGSDGYRENASSRQGGARLSIKRTAWSFDLSGNAIDREEPGLLSADEVLADRRASNPLFRFDEDETLRGRVSLGFDRALSASSTAISTLLYGSVRESDGIRTLLLGPGVADSAARATDTSSAGASFDVHRQLSLFGRAMTLRAAGDLERGSLETVYRSVSETGAPLERTAATDATRDRIGIAVSGDWYVTPRLRVNGGIRYDEIDDDTDRPEAVEDLHAVSPRLGANLRLGDEAAPLVLWAQASRSFRAPALDQRFDPRPFPDFAGGTFTISNPDLEPQRAETVEAGASRSTRSLQWQLALYHMNVEDEIDFDPATFRYTNIGRTTHEGAELSVRANAGSTVRPFLTYTWMKVESRSEENRGRQLKNIPLHTIVIGAWIELPWEAEVTPQLRWMQGRYLDDANQVSLGEPAILDIRLQKDFRGGLRAGIDLLNVTGEEYSEVGIALSDFSGGVVPYYFPAPSASARLFIDWRFD